MLDSIPTAWEMYQKLFKPVRLTLRAAQLSHFDAYLRYHDTGYPLDLLWNDVAVAEGRQSGISVDLSKIELPATLPVAIDLSSQDMIVESVDKALKTYLDSHILWKYKVLVNIGNLDSKRYFDVNYASHEHVFQVLLDPSQLDSPIGITRFNVIPFKLLSTDAQFVYERASEARSAALAAKEAQEKITAANTSFEEFQIAVLSAQRNNIL